MLPGDFLLTAFSLGAPEAGLEAADLGSEKVDRDEPPCGFASLDFGAVLPGDLAFPGFGTVPDGDFASPRLSPLFRDCRCLDSESCRWFCGGSCW